MKYIRILTIALLSLLLVGQAEAQVSVRRSSRNTTQNTSTKRGGTKNSGKNNKSSGKNDNSSEKKSSNSQSKNNNGSGKANPSAPVVTKKNPSNAKKQTSGVATGKTVRQQAFDEYQKDEAQDTPWQHVVYRELDLTKGDNASLYFPIEPMDGLTSLFRVIMDAFAKGELPAYEYLDGREVFTEKFRVKPKDIFDKFDIYYKADTTKMINGNMQIEVDESDVPSSEVLSYFVKERWEFDQKHSKYQARILSICPVLHRSGDFSSDAVKYPMFWINYEDLRPFLRDHLVVSQGMNTAPRFTMEEFFSLGHYKGDIYKEQNLRGLSLKQQVGDNPDSLKLAQQKLDNDLRAFEDSIWVKDPLPEEQIDKRKRKAAIKSSAVTAGDETSAKKNRRTKEVVDMEAVEEEREEKATTHKSVRR